MSFDTGGPRLRILGITQDGGLPQPACLCANCRRARSAAQQRRLPACLALFEGNGSRDWHLFEATPYMPEQLDKMTACDGSATLMKSVFLTHAHIGHYTGLMHLGREVMGTRDLPVYAGPQMSGVLRTHAPWSQLVDLGNIALQPLLPGQTVTLTSNLTVTPLPVRHRNEFSETFGFVIRGPRASALFMPDVDGWTDNPFDIRELAASVDYCLLDATFFSADELPGRNLCEIPHPLVSHTMDLLQNIVDRKLTEVVFIHMNHSNPLLDVDSPAYRATSSRGYRVAAEGMEMLL